MALYTHTQKKSTFREIKRVATEAALFGVKNRLFVALYEVKNKVLEIACFLSSKKIVSGKLFFVENNYADCKEFLCNYHCLEILAMCFLSSKKLVLMRENYTYIITTKNPAKVGGVE